MQLHAFLGKEHIAFHLSHSCFVDFNSLVWNTNSGKTPARQCFYDLATFSGLFCLFVFLQGNPDLQSQCSGIPCCLNLSRVPEAPEDQPQTWISNIRVSSGDPPPNQLRGTKMDSGQPAESACGRTLRYCLYRKMPSLGSNAGEMEWPQYILIQQSASVPNSVIIIIIIRCLVVITSYYQQ